MPAWPRILLGSMLRLLAAHLPAIRSAMRSHRDLVLENLAPRQQLATFAARRLKSVRRFG